MYIVLFNIAGVAMFGWALMIFLPNWDPTRHLVEWAAFPALLALVYIIGMVPLLLAAGPGIMLDFGSAPGVQGLLADADIAMVVWIHILAFDHLVGVFIYRDNMREGVVPVPVQSLILFLTLMFGPAGFLVYYTIRLARKKGPAIGDSPPTPEPVVET